MKDKNIYELLNKVKINIPDQVEELEDEERDKIKNNFLKNIKKEKKKNKFFLKLGLAASFIFFLAFTRPGQVALGKMVNFYNLLVNPISEIAIEKDDVENVVSKINKTIEINGIKITLKEALLDDHTLYLNVLYELVDKEAYKDFDEDAVLVPVSTLRLYLDGKDRIKTSRTDDDYLSLSGGTLKGTIPENGQQQQFLKYQLNSYIELDNKNNFSLKFNELSLMDLKDFDFKKENFGITNVKEIEGKGEISFSISDSTEKLNTKDISIDKEIATIDGLSVYIRSIRINPMITKIKFSREFNKEAHDSLLAVSPRRHFMDSISFVAKDEKNNVFEFSKSEITDDFYNLYLVGDNREKIFLSKELTIEPVFSDSLKDLDKNIYSITNKPIKIKLK